MSWNDLIGFAASGMVLATFCMTRMLLLRLFAIMSNMLFGAYGYLDHLYPVLLLHLILLPINCIRVRECLTETRLHTHVSSARTNREVRAQPTVSTGDSSVRDRIGTNHQHRCTNPGLEHLRSHSWSTEVE